MARIKKLEKKLTERKVVVYGLGLNSLKSEPVYNRVIEIHPMKQKSRFARLLLKDVSRYFG